MLRALLFDAAGTLIEPAESVASVYSRAAARHGLVLSEDSLKSAFRQVFSGLADPDWAAHPEGDAAERAWWRQVVGETLTTASGQPVQEDIAGSCFEELFAHYAAPEAWHVFPEVRDVLATVRERGWKCAVVSNFDRRLHGILAGHGLEFDLVVTSADAKARKPAAQIFHHALSELGISPAEAAHTGDSRSADIAGAEALGIPAFLIDRPASDLRDFLVWAESR